MFTFSVLCLFGPHRSMLTNCLCIITTIWQTWLSNFMWTKWLVLKKGLIINKNLCDEHGQKVVGFGFVWSLLKAQGFESWMSNSFCQKDHERHLLRHCWMRYLLFSKFKKSLYTIFYQFWKIFNITTLKTLKLLG